MSSGTIFAGSAIKTLKQTLSLNGVAFVGSGSADPSSSGFTAPVGSIYLRTNGSFYVKTGALDTNWTAGVISGGSASFTDSTFQITDDVDPTKIMKFQVSGLSSATTRTYTAPDRNGLLAVGTYAGGQVVFWEGPSTLNLFSNSSSSTQSSMPTGFPGLYHGGEFTTTSAGLATGGTVRLQKLGATGTFVVELYSFSGGLPNTLLASSSPINAATAVLEFPGESDVPFTFSSPVSLLAGTQYYLVFNVTGITSGPSTLFWYYQAGAQTRARSQDGISWFTLTPAGLIRATVYQQTAGTGLGSEIALSPVRGGTGVVNDVANTITFTGQYSLGLTLSAATSLNLPASGTLATLAGSEALTNKTISLSSASLSFMTISSGTGGAAGFAQFGQQSAPVSTPSASYRIYNTGDDHLAWMRPDGFVRKFGGTLSASRTLTMPDASGTLALIDLAQTFSAVQTFSSTPVFQTGISIGVPNVVTIAPAGSITAHTLTWPGTAPASLSEVLSYTGGSFTLGWRHPGEISYLAGEAIAANDVVYIAQAGDGGRTVGRVYKADASNALRSVVVGVAIAAQGTVGNAVRIQTVGEKSGFSVAGTVGQVAYLSGTTPGAVTTTVGSVIVGTFVAANTVALRIATASSTSFSDAAFSIFNSTTPSKVAVFDASAISTATTRTFSFPDISGTIAVLSATQTFSGVNTFSNASPTTFNNGIRLGVPTNTVTITAQGSTSAYTVQMPNAAPLASGMVLTSAGGTILDWNYPGEIFYTSGEALTAGDVVYMSRGTANGDTGRTQGLIYKADASNDNRIDVLGVVVASVAISNTVRIQPVGERSGYTGLTRGQPVFLSPTTPGAVQVSAPTGAGQWIVQVGIASQSTTLFINPAAASSAIYIESSSVQTASILNNTASPTAVTGMLLNGSSYKGAVISYVVDRSTSLSQVVETGTLRAVFKSTTSTWYLDNTALEDAGVDFTINSSGQILYTSTNISGTSYTGTIIWNLETIG